MAQELSEKIDEQTEKDVLVGKIVSNYTKVKKSYKKIIGKAFESHEKLEISTIYDRILIDLHWDSQKRPTVRQLVNRYKKEISNDKKQK